MPEQSYVGGCQCGRIRYRAEGAPLMAALCHCSMCRRAHAAPSVAWAMFAEGQVLFEGEKPQPYASSPGCTRSFCPHCGTPISFAAEYIPGLVDIAIGSLDNPDAIAPTFHYWDARRLEWDVPGDGLPRHAEFPPLE